MRNKLNFLVIGIAFVLVVLSVWFVKLIWLKPFSINTFFERVYIEFLWNDPEALSQTGVLEPFGLTGYKSKLTNLSPTEMQHLADVGRRNLNILEKYNRNKLDATDAVSYDVFYWFLKTGVAGEPFLFYDYPVTHISGAHIELPRFMASLPLESEKDIQRYLDRLNKIDEKFGSLIDALEHRRKLGVIPPTHILEKVMAYFDTFLKGAATENEFYLQFEKKLTTIEMLPEKLQQQYLDDCLITVQDKVIPSYKRLAQYIRQLEHNSLAIAGVWKLPEGEAYYRNCLLQQTTLAIDPDSLYALGKLEMSRLQGEIAILENLAGSLNTPLLSTNEAGRANTLHLFKSVNEQMKPLLADYFLTLPTTALEVLEVPENRSANATLAFYVPPRGQPLSNGKLYVNTWRFNDVTPQLAKTYAYHEGIPGHHVQKSIQATLHQLPTFRRFLPFTAFTEGWAMYAEQLGHEMTGTQNPWDRISVLQSDLFRTARMMTDIGIHHKRWLRDQAIRFMVKNAALTEAAAEAEVDRYIVWPGQGCAYKVGQMKFLELRQYAQAQLGVQFDIKAFHEVLIGQGAMPLSVLETRVHNWIEQTKKTP